MVLDKIIATNGIVLVLNPNKNIVNKIIERCKINEGYCPCKPNKIEENICPCIDAREHGHCCCTLYIKESSND